MVAAALKVVHVTTASRGVAPGICAAVEGISRASAGQAGLTVGVVGVVPPADDWAIGREGSMVRERVPIQGPRLLSYAPGLATLLESLGPQLVHQHGAWQLPGVVAAHFCRGKSLPLVLSPHGMFAAVGMASHRGRKAAAWVAYQRGVSTAADLIHATSISEMTAVRDLGLRNPVAVIPLGVEVSSTLPAKRSKDIRRALYLGRLDPLKGVGDLVEAWAAVRPASWTLTIAGPDHRGYATNLGHLVATHGLHGVVELRGPVWGGDRDALLESADLLVLPSYSENFGLVVAEALAAAVPVIATTSTPWQCLEDEACGWLVPRGAKGLAFGLAAACASDDDTLRTMGFRGWHMARSRFNWDRIGADFHHAYRWLCGGGDRPACVHLG